MSVRADINLFARAEDKPVLLYLFSKYHWQSQWNFVAKCRWAGLYPNRHRIWSPTEEGLILYKYSLTK